MLAETNSRAFLANGMLALGIGSMGSVDEVRWAIIVRPVRPGYSCRRAYRSASQSSGRGSVRYFRSSPDCIFLPFTSIRSGKNVLPFNPSIRSRKIVPFNPSIMHSTDQRLRSSMPTIHSRIEPTTVRLVEAPLTNHSRITASDIPWSMLYGPMRHVLYTFRVTALKSSILVLKKRKD